MRIISRYGRAPLLLAAIVFFSSPGTARASYVTPTFSGYGLVDLADGQGNSLGTDQVGRAKASRTFSSNDRGLAVRLELGRGQSGAYRFLILDLPPVVLVAWKGTIQEDKFTLTYYEKTEAGEIAFYSDAWSGELSWVDGNTRDEPDLLLKGEFTVSDDQGDKRILTGLTLELYEGAAAGVVPSGDVDSEVYVSGEVFYYDDGCYSEPSDDSYYDDNEPYYGEDDSGCDGDTFDDGDSSSSDDWSDDSSCDGDVDSGDDDSDWTGDWTGDEFSQKSPLGAKTRIQGMSVAGLWPRYLRPWRKPIRFAIPLMLAVSMVLALRLLGSHRQRSLHRS